MSKKKEEMKELKNKSQIMIALFSFLGIAMVATLIATNFTGKGTYSVEYECPDGGTLSGYSCIAYCANTSSGNTCTAYEAKGFDCSTMTGSSSQGASFKCVKDAKPTSTTIDGYTITFNANGGTGGGIKTCTPNTVGGSCSVQAPGGGSKSGYNFNGWGSSSTCTTGTIFATQSATVSGDTTYYACWKATATPTCDSSKNEYGSESTCIAQARGVCGGINGTYTGCNEATKTSSGCYKFTCNDTTSTAITCADLVPSGSLFGGESKSTCKTTADATCGLGNYTGCENAIHDEDDTISCFTYQCKGSKTCMELISNGWIFGGESKTTCTTNAKNACGEGKYEGCEHAIHDEDDTISCFQYRCNGASTCSELIPNGWSFGGESKSTCQTTANRACGTGKYTGCENAIHDEDDTISCFTYKCVNATPTPPTCDSSKNEYADESTCIAQARGVCGGINGTYTGCNEATKTSSGCYKFTCNGTTPPDDGVTPPDDGPDPTTTPSGSNQTCYVCVSGEQSQYVWASSSDNAAKAATTLSGITGKNCATTSESNCKGIAVSNCYECNGSKKYVMATSDADAKSQSGGTSCTIVTTDKCNTVNPPKTGTFGIIIAWIIGMMTIGYAMWYFKKVNL